MEKRIQIPLQLYEQMVSYISNHYDPLDSTYKAIQQGIEKNAMRNFAALSTLLTKLLIIQIQGKRCVNYIWKTPVSLVSGVLKLNDRLKMVISHSEHSPLSEKRNRLHCCRAVPFRLVH